MTARDVDALPGVDIGPDPSDTTYVVDFAYLFHEAGQQTRHAHERHVHGLFTRATWLRLLTEVGFRAAVLPFAHSELPDDSVVVFAGRRPARRRYRRHVTARLGSRWPWDSSRPRVAELGSVTEWLLDARGDRLLRLPRR